MPATTGPLTTVDIWTGSTCIGSASGVGGWSAILVRRDPRDPRGDRERTVSGSAAPTTANRMDITAAIEALKVLKKPFRVRLHTGNEVVVNTMTEWLPKRLVAGWATVENADLWQILHALSLRHDVEWVHMPAKAKDTRGQRCAALARAEAAARWPLAARPSEAGRAAKPPTGGSVRRPNVPSRKAGSRPAEGRANRAKPAPAPAKLRTTGQAKKDSALHFKTYMARYAETFDDALLAAGDVGIDLHPVDFSLFLGMLSQLTLDVGREHAATFAKDLYDLVASGGLGDYDGLKVTPFDDIGYC